MLMKSRRELLLSALAAPALAVPALAAPTNEEPYGGEEDEGYPYYPSPETLIGLFMVRERIGEVPLGVKNDELRRKAVEFAADLLDLYRDDERLAQLADYLRHSGSRS